ncbi:MAG: metalloregulator ArsR/SmtB family transcription factor [Halieaceae bacterium]|nr:metalloregulator ArsR/SmtB family transcription factor [Halieaceae bacterium]
MTAISKVIPLSPTNRARGTHEPLHALFSAAGHPLRMGILRVLKAESFSVSELCDLFSMRQSALSHHLKILADANLLSRRREGTATFYRRQLPEGQHENLRQTMFDDIDQEPLGHDLVLGRQRVQCQREQHSATFFREHGEQFKRHQESIASWEDYSRATLHLLDRAGSFRDNKILEVGPGDGRLLPALSERGAAVVALDNAEEMLDTAKKTAGAFGNIQFCLGEPASLTHHTGAFSAAVVNMVLHHVPDPERLIAEVAQLLASRGHLIVSELCPHDQAWAREHCGDLWLGLDPDALHTWAAAAGLEHNAALVFGQRNGFQIQIQHFTRH